MGVRVPPAVLLKIFYSVYTFGAGNVTINTSPFLLISIYEEVDVVYVNTEAERPEIMLSIPVMLS